MARRVPCILLLCIALSAAWAEEQGNSRVEDERRWNTPPELTPEQVVEKSDDRKEHGRSLPIPIAASIDLGTGDNAHSLGLQLGPQGLGFSESNTFNRPLSNANGFAVSNSQSVAFVAGSGGIAAAASQSFGQSHSGHANQGGANSQSFSFGAAAGSSHGGIVSGASASSSASSSAGHGGFSSGGSLGVQQQSQIQGRPIWTNIRPNYENNGYYNPWQPTLNIDVRPHGRLHYEPIDLDISQGPRWQQRRPNVQIHKWQPGRRPHYEQSKEWRDINGGPGNLQISVS